MAIKLPDWLKPDPENDDCVIGTNGHRYPSKYYPGQDADLDKAWEILDHVNPGVIPQNVRCLLAGMITGVLTAQRRDSK